MQPHLSVTPKRSTLGSKIGQIPVVKTTHRQFGHVSLMHFSKNLEVWGLEVGFGKFTQTVSPLPSLKLT